MTNSVGITKDTLKQPELACLGGTVAVKTLSVANPELDLRPAMPKSRPSRTVRVYSDTADEIEIITRGFGLSSAEYLERITGKIIRRDAVKARKLIAERDKMLKHLGPQADANDE